MGALKTYTKSNIAQTELALFMQVVLLYYVCVLYIHICISM